MSEGSERACLSGMMSCPATTSLKIPIADQLFACAHSYIGQTRTAKADHSRLAAHLQECVRRGCSMINWEGLPTIELQSAPFPSYQRHEMQRHYFVQIRRPCCSLLGCSLQVRHQSLASSINGLCRSIVEVHDALCHQAACNPGHPGCAWVGCCVQILNGKWCQSFWLTRCSDISS